MSRFVSIFFLSVFISILLFFALAMFFGSENYIESAIYTFGTIIILLLSFLISMMFYLIDLVKKQKYKR